MDEQKLLARVRQICLPLPEVRETVKWGHPTFEAGKKMFAVIDHYEDQPCLAFRVPLERVETILADSRFFEAPYGGRFGWVCLRTDKALKWPEVESLLVESYRQVALKRMLAALDQVK